MEETILNIVDKHTTQVQKIGPALEASDYPLSVDFRQWFLQPDFPAHLLFTDEATFTQEGVFNMRNTHVWATKNPLAVRSNVFQKHFSVNVWTVFVNDPSLAHTSYQRDSMAHVI
ncbi:hypothetical protein AVEN_14866-1 [Araneus ventricosus]|uniref:Uncharacterized protein n=1 Tax=Araneus ventricosus TaxID=182803 RepID=A0A4Y2X6Y6_ARAVE|nr:hypothetical protein AVEN_14866-1 [Araneus ventricosus]